MGAMLEKPVMCTVVEKQVSKNFSVAVSELNGYRNNMEDAHVIHMCDDWAVFGVFDGHGGEQCSKWIASRFCKEFKDAGCPKDDEAVKKLYLKIDREFLDTGLPSGTTATMCIIQKPAPGGEGKYRLRVINAGDSRVLLGRSDGTIVDGGGTDEGLTTDHKPNHPSERERIEANGGTVEIAMGGVARLNGDLAVSRGFGDADYKRQGPDPQDLERQPSTACPELGSFECDESDFVVLVCDGVSEGDFSNSEVVRLIAEDLKELKGKEGVDALGVAATHVCHKAVQQNSKDNVTCMIVSLKGGSELHQKDFNAGPISCPGNKTFMKAYTEMASRGGLTLEEAIEKRYDQILEKQASGAKVTDDEAKDDKLDLDLIGEPSGERTQYFKQVVKKMGESAPSDDGPAGIQGLPPQLLSLLQSSGQLGPSGP